MSEKDEKLNKGSFLYIGNQDKAEWGYPEGYPHETEEIILDGTFEFADYYNNYYEHQIADENFTIVDGRSYIIIWDGIIYKCVATNVEGTIVLGNSGIMNIGTDTGEPFLFLYMDNTVQRILTNDTAATHTITVREEIVYPMASAFLPQATQTTYGAIKKAAAVANVTAAPTAEEFNALLKSLRDAGILATS